MIAVLLTNVLTKFVVYVLEGPWNDDRPFHFFAVSTFVAFTRRHDCAENASRKTVSERVPSEIWQCGHGKIGEVMSTFITRDGCSSYPPRPLSFPLSSGAEDFLAGHLPEGIVQHDSQDDSSAPNECPDQVRGVCVGRALER